MKKVKNGDRVSFDYTGTLEDGTIFDSTMTSECEDGCETDSCTDDSCDCASGPMEITLGAEEFFPQVETALIGMLPGETKKVTVPAEEAFGEYDEERVFSVPVSELPEELRPDVGDELVLTGDDDEELGVTVVEVTPEAITFDANHPLAGEDLIFEITLREIL